MSAKRPKLDSAVAEEEAGGLYHPSERPLFLPSGCTLLNLALGGGWALHRVANLVGDKSTGKTLLAIEASANFAKKFPTGLIYYLEAEAAFDLTYAEQLGLPVERVNFVKERSTVEDWFEHLESVVRASQKHPEREVLYIVDSLDALSDRSERERKVGDSSYGMGKSKKLSELFRRQIQDLNQSKITLIIISQVRDNIAIGFGKKQTRAGGRALDFYASQQVWLTHLGRIHKVRRGVKRAVGVTVQAKVEKSKVGPPFCEAIFPIIFSYGIEDLTASLNFLLQVKGACKEAGMTEQEAKELLGDVETLPDEQYSHHRLRCAKAIRRVWKQIEASFAPARRKY